MKVRVLPEAVAELRAARDWYEERRAGLGLEFVAAIRSLMQRIQVAPTQFALAPRSRDVRRVVADRFPYVVLFLVHEDAAHVIAVAHQHQRPVYWRERIGKAQGR